MQDLCPLCLKNGMKKKVKLLQINLQEAVWVCEEEKCIWPFGYEDFIFYPRLIGKIWSCYWDDNKATSSIKETVKTLTKLTFKDSATKCIIDSNLDVNHPESISANNSLHVIKTKNNINDLHIFTHKTLNIQSQDNKNHQFNLNNSLNKEIISSPNLKNSNLKSTSEDIKIIKTKIECINSLDKHNQEEKDFCIPNIQNVNSLRVAPKIMRIEKTNIDISDVITRNKTSAGYDLDKKCITINKSMPETNNKLSSTNGELLSNPLSESKKLLNLELFDSSKLNDELAISKSNLSVTTMEIDGLPPITLSFNVPVSTRLETVTSNIQQTNYKSNTTGDIDSNNKRSNAPEVKCLPAKRSVTSGKQYEKFSFSAIKKKIVQNNPININNHDTVFSRSNFSMKDTKNDSTNNIKENSAGNAHSNCNVVSYNRTTSVTNNYMEHQSNDSVIINNVSSQETITPGSSVVNKENAISDTSVVNKENTIPDTSVLNTTVNIDTVLEDFLSTNYNVSEDINDEWLNSILS